MTFRNVPAFATHIAVPVEVPHLGTVAVDVAYGDLTEAGYAGQQPPFDAFWGARYAVVTDPDGNADVVKVARLLWEGRDYEFTETAFISLARPSVPEGLERCRQVWPGRSVRISAQAHLQRFYGSLGFVVVSDEYLEDDIPHIEMLWSPP